MSALLHFITKEKPEIYSQIWLKLNTRCRIYGEKEKQQQQKPKQRNSL